LSEDSRPQHSPVSGVTGYEEALDFLVESAATSLRIFDFTLSRGFNSPRRTEALRRFLLATRRNTVRIVVHEPAHLDRNCPRLLNLLRIFSHTLVVHETLPQAKSVYDPFAIADERHFVHRFHFDDLRGLAGHDDPIGAHALIDRFEEIWEASAPAATGTTLGI